MVLPNPEPVGIPAPVWLLQILLVLTFTLHITAMAMTVGGTLIATGCEIWCRLRPGGEHRALALRLWKLLPTVTAFTITLGVAPLLFVQVIYGKFFYPASVLVGWSWFSVVPLLIIGYCLLYAQSLCRPEAGWRPWAGLGAMIAFLTILAIYVSTMSLTTAPELWKGMYAATPRGTHFYFQLPRALHVLLGAMAMGGGLTALLGHLSGDHAFGLTARRLGAATLWLSLLLQAPVSLWYLGTIAPAGRAAVQLWIPALAAVLGLGAGVLLLAGRLGSPRPLAGWLGMGALIGATALLAVQRHLVRQALMQPHLTAADWQVAPQWSVLVIFAVLLLMTIGLITFLVYRFLMESRAAAPSFREVARKG